MPSIKDKERIIMSEELARLLADLKEVEAITFVEKALEQGTDPAELLERTKEGMGIVGQRFADGAYFIPELIFSGEILKGIVEILKPRLQKVELERSGKVIMGTVAGDIHDIGKDLVVFMLDVNGFDVTDLGIDVPAERFIDAIRETGGRVVGLSGFLTLAFDSMKKTVEAIREAGLRDDLKIMVGGGQINEQVRAFTGADAYGRDAVEAVKLARRWIGG
jgi:methanogenic corrinoid protein MtbC1